MLGNLDVWCLCFLISFIGRGEITKNRQHKITQPLTRTFSHHWNTPHIGTRVDGKYMSKQAVANFDSCYRLKELYILIAIIFLCMIMFESFDCKLQVEKLITLRLMMMIMMKWVVASLSVCHICNTMQYSLPIAFLTRTNWPRKVCELILDSDSRSQGVKG